MNARERLELSHFRPESFRTMKDAGIDYERRSDDRLARAERIGATVGWIGFTALIIAVMFV